jgi:hypothetical protein
MAAKILPNWEKSPCDSDGKQNRKREREPLAALIFFQHNPQHAPTLKKEETNLKPILKILGPVSEPDTEARFLV